MLLLKAGNCFRDQVLGACPQVSSPETDVPQAFHRHHPLHGGLRVGCFGVARQCPPTPLQQRYDQRHSFTQPAPSRRIALGWRASSSAPKPSMPCSMRWATQFTCLSPDPVSADQYFGLQLLYRVGHLFAS